MGRGPECLGMPEFGWGRDLVALNIFIPEKWQTLPEICRLHPVLT